MRKSFFLILPQLIYFGCTGVDPTEELQEKLAKYERQNELLQEKVSALRASLDSLVHITSNAKSAENSWFDEQAASRALKMNVKDPENFIVNTLRERTELIPLKPVLGGTMRFVKAQLLGEKWLIAEYEDGHIRGRSIFEYHFNKDGEINFRRIVSSSE